MLRHILISSFLSSVIRQGGAAGYRKNHQDKKKVFHRRKYSTQIPIVKEVKLIPLIDTKSRFEFTSKTDEAEVKTVFVFKPLSGREMLTFAADSQGGQLKLSGEKIFQFLEMAIVEIKNCGGGTVKEILDRVPPMIIAELVEQAGKMNKLTGEDAKN